MSNSFQNPLPITGIGDPYLLTASDQRYYLYATSSPIGFKVWSSDDLICWTDHGLCYEKGKDSWGEKDFWAPECTEYKGKFYLYYSAHWKNNPNEELENFRLGVAVADDPLGPFQDLSSEPLFDPGYPVIDAHLFIDEDDRKYLYYSRCCYKHQVGPYEESHIWGLELSDDMKTPLSKSIKLLWPHQKWESESAESTGRRWNEGPFVFRHRNCYYLTFSANHYQDKEYSVGAARSSHPLGPFVKQENNPILKHDWPRVSGPGHNSCAVTHQGERIIIYHRHTDPYIGGSDRQVCMDHMNIDDEGYLKVLGPTTTPQPMIR